MNKRKLIRQHKKIRKTMCDRVKTIVSLYNSSKALKDLAISTKDQVFLEIALINCYNTEKLILQTDELLDLDDAFVDNALSC